MERGASVRWYRLRRHPFGYWLVTFVLAGLAASSVGRVTAQADAAERQWGRRVSVVVVRSPVAAGAVVAVGDVVTASVPASLVPSGAAASVDVVVGRAALVDLSAGEVVLTRRLAPDGLRGVVALIPPGMRAVAVPVGDSALRLSVGDAVDVLATFEVDPAAGAPTVAVASGALVVEVRADAVTVAVPADAAPRVAYALARGTLTLALSPRPLEGSASPVGAEPSTGR
jgi:Flp pilus assembly protein CpaB